MAVHLFREVGDWPRLRSGARYQYQEVSYEGAVLSESSESYRIMSDVWGDRYFAMVWNAEIGVPEKVTLCVVDYQSMLSDWQSWGHNSFARVDATPEVLEAYQAWERAEEERKTLTRFKANVNQGRERANTVEKGSYVELSRKRCKVPYGTQGRVFWVGESRYGERVGFRNEEGETFWTALRNVSVVEGHEKWGPGNCPQCGGAGWVPSYDGAGGTKECSECRRRYEAHKEEEEKKTRELEAVEAGVAEVSKGTQVEVVSGRSAGETGRVFWVGPNKFGPGLRFGVESSVGTLWVNEDQVRPAA